MEGGRGGTARGRVRGREGGRGGTARVRVRGREGEHVGGIEREEGMSQQ